MIETNGSQSVDVDPDREDPIIGEVVEDAKSEGGGQVPFPTDLVEDYGGASKYQLPEELVTYKYPAVPVQAVRQPLTLTHRILWADASIIADLRCDLGPYEGAVTNIERHFPIRVARLRELFAICRSSEIRKAQLCEQRELEREALNRRNSEVNRQIAEEIGNLQADWEAFRAEYNRDIRSTEDALIDYKMTRQNSVEDARTAYWEVRERTAKERDDRQSRQRAAHERTEQEDAEYQRLERERRTQTDERLQADHEAERRRLSGAAEGADLTHADATTALTQAELEAIDRRNAAAGPAWERYQTILESTYERIIRLKEDISEKAIAATTELRAERSIREEVYSEVQQECIDERRRLEREVSEAEKTVASAAAQAGLVPGEIGQDIRGAATGGLSEDIVAGTTATGHLHLDSGEVSPPGAKNRHWRSFGHGVIHLCTLLVLGAVFGVSLGLVLGLFDLSEESLRHEWGYAVACGLAGVFVFRVMGGLARRSAAYASEELHADTHTVRTSCTAALAGLIIIVMIVLEAYVERYGIVQSVIQRQLMYGNRHEIATEMKIAYWAVAFIISMPFVVYHAYEGAIHTRHGLGFKRRREALASRKNDALQAPALSEAIAAQGILLAARARVTTIDTEHSIRRDEADRRIHEVDNLIDTHPAVVRWNTFITSSEAIPEEDPLVLHAKAELDRALDSHTTDPSVHVAQRLADSARERAVELNNRSGAAHSRVVQALSHAGEHIVDTTSVAVSGVVTALGEAVADSASQPLNGASRALPAPLHIASEVLLNPPKQLNPIELETNEEAMARQRWHSVRSAIFNDPQVRFYRNRISTLQSLVRSADARYARRRKQLRDQMRAVEVRLMAPEGSNRTSFYIEQAIFEEELNAKAAKVAFDAELSRLRELSEVPTLLRWYVAWRHRRLMSEVLVVRTAAVEHARFLPAGSVQDRDDPTAGTGEIDRSEELRSRS